MNSRKLVSGLAEKALFGLAWLASRYSYPLRWERLALDANQSVWATYTPDYSPRPALQEDISADLAIIGGGFTGVSTAYHFSRRFPAKRVVLLEASTLANGASGRSGGLMSNWMYGVDTGDPAQLQRIFRVTCAAIDEIEAIARRHQLPAETLNRAGSLRVATSARGGEALHQQVEMLRGLDIPAEFLSPQAVAARIGLAPTHGAYLDPTAGLLNGTLYLRGLRPVLEEQGVAVYENTPVLNVEEGPGITLTTPAGQVQAPAIVLATNAYTGKLGYFRKQIIPLVGHVLATAPHAAGSGGWQQVTAFENDRLEVMWASQTARGEIVFGGGAHGAVDYHFNNRTVFPGSGENALRRQHALQRALATYLPGAPHFQIAHRWSGPVGMTLSFGSTIGVRGEYHNVFYGLGYNGHGVTLANLAGQVITDLYSGDDAAWRGLPFYRASLPAVPLDPLRWMGVRLFQRLAL